MHYVLRTKINRCIERNKVILLLKNASCRNTKTHFHTMQETHICICVTLL